MLTIFTTGKIPNKHLINNSNYTLSQQASVALALSCIAKDTLLKLFFKNLLNQYLLYLRAGREQVPPSVLYFLMCHTFFLSVMRKTPLRCFYKPV